MTTEINNSIEALKSGGLILYPTDTVWGIGCDATNEAAVTKVYQLKNREDSKALICLVANQAMLERYVEKVPDVAYDIIDLATKPTTIDYVVNLHQEKENSSPSSIIKLSNDGTVKVIRE